jgi:hypothetical protein
LETQELLNKLIFSGRGSAALYAILTSLETKERKILLPVNICEIVIPVINTGRIYPRFL